MGTSRRKFTSEFKKKVVLEALKERNTIQELAAKHDIHPQQITDWKKHFLENSESAFGRAGSDESKSLEKEKLIEQLYAQIGQLKVENDFLKKKSL
ncbi:MAG: transposase [Chitinophagaceae bacterium]